MTKRDPVTEMISFVSLTAIVMNLAKCEAEAAAIARGEWGEALWTAPDLAPSSFIANLANPLRFLVSSVDR